MGENKKPRNPNAFPTPCETSYEFNDAGQTVGSQDGMTLRDYFAAKAMQYFINANNGNFCDNDAAQIYYIADAMLKQREL